jgi:hypothetical protein
MIDLVGVWEIGAVLIGFPIFFWHCLRRWPRLGI